jgi:orotate phosphoribosyltransferase
MNNGQKMIKHAPFPQTVDRERLGISADTEKIMNAFHERKILKLFEGGTKRLKSGEESYFYFDDRGSVTEDTEFGLLIGDCLRKVVNDIAITHASGKKIILLGVPTAGTALAAATVFAQQKEIDSKVVHQPRSFGYRQIRENQKDHGLNANWVNGTPPDHENHFYIILENVTNAGTSIKIAANHLKKDNYDLRQMHAITLINRGTPGTYDDILKNTSLAGLHAVYNLSELLDYYIQQDWFKPNVGLMYEEEWNRLTLHERVDDQYALRPH